ncbi:MAG TPA: hypothetical protein VGM90_37410 [Kofleriaceae bacterium]|jgi:hypothetical protein
MRAIAPIVLALAVVSVPAMADTSKDPVPTKVELNPGKNDVVVLKDAEGGIYVVVGATQGDSGSRQVFYGKGKQLYRQRTLHASQDGTTGYWSIGVWTPRLSNFHDGEIDHKQDGTFERNCGGEDDAALTEVTGEKAQQILSKSQFLSPLFVRRVRLIGRDDTGVYYLVDELNGENKGRGFRLFVGRKGALKQQPLSDIATDDAGESYTTKTGTFTVTFKHTTSTNVETDGEVATTATGTWVKGERRSPISMLDTRNQKNDVLVYKELGLYDSLGTICDNVE